jgi:hypothetical protein
LQIHIYQRSQQSISFMKQHFIQLVSRLTPIRCGISDHAIAVAEELESRFEIQCSFVVLNSSERCELSYQQIFTSTPQLLEACIRLSNGDPAAVLLHYSPYGFAANGAPVALVEAFRRVRMSGRFRAGVYFHELFATSMPWRSAFWYSYHQQRVIRKLARQCDFVATNTTRHQDWLQREALPGADIPFERLPILSNIGESDRPRPAASRRPVLVIFGLPASRQRAYRQLSSLGKLLKILKVSDIKDIGPEFDAPPALHGIAIRRMGLLSPTDLAHVVSESMYGFVSHDPDGLAKSGVFAGICAHGAVPVIAESFIGEVDGLRDGVHLASPRTAGNVVAAGLENCSMGAWRWYMTHRLNVHARVYAGLLHRDQSNSINKIWFERISK